MITAEPRRQANRATIYVYSGPEPSLKVAFTYTCAEVLEVGLSDSTGNPLILYALDL
jgi:hypothetical protein